MDKIDPHTFRYLVYDETDISNHKGKQTKINDGPDNPTIILEKIKLDLNLILYPSEKLPNG